MSLDNWQLLLAYFGLGSGLLAILCHIVLRFTLDRRIRSVLPASKTYDGFYDGFFGLLRTSLFANASILPGKRFQKTMDIFYNGFRIKGFANHFEKTVAYIYFTCGSLMILVCLIVFITDFFGIVDWSSE